MSLSLCWSLQQRHKTYRKLFLVFSLWSTHFCSAWFTCLALPFLLLFQTHLLFFADAFSSAQCGCLCMVPMFLHKQSLLVPVTPLICANMEYTAENYHSFCVNMYRPICPSFGEKVVKTPTIMKPHRATCVPKRTVHRTTKNGVCFLCSDNNLSTANPYHHLHPAIGCVLCTFCSQSCWRGSLATINYSCLSRHGPCVCVCVHFCLVLRCAQHSHDSSAAGIFSAAAIDGHEKSGILVTWTTNQWILRAQHPALSLRETIPIRNDLVRQISGLLYWDGSEICFYSPTTFPPRDLQGKKIAQAHKNWFCSIWSR